MNLSENVALAMQLLSHKTGRERKSPQRCPRRAVRVVGEPGALHQVWVNLIDNAIQAAGPGPGEGDVERVGLKGLGGGH